VWGGGSTGPVRARHLEGAAVVGWEGTDTSALERAGLPFRPLAEVVGPDGLAAAEAAARTFARVWGRLPLRDGKSFRELLSWRGMSLLFSAESFIRTATAGPACARKAELALRLLEETRPAELDIHGLDPPDAALLSRGANVRGILHHGPRWASLRPIPPTHVIPRHPRGRLRGLLAALAPDVPPPLPAPAAPGASGGAAPLLLLAERGEAVSTARPLLEALASELARPALTVTMADLGRWRTRRVRRAVAEAEARLGEEWRRLRGQPGLVESYSHRGVGFADLAGRDLEALMLGRLPQAVLLLEAAAELLAAVRPMAVLLAVAGRDDRRPLLRACAESGAPAIVLRFSPEGEEEADRADGGPQPALSLAWEPGSDPGVLAARLRALARDTVEAR